MNKMDRVGYKQSRYIELANQMKSMLVEIGWERDFVEKHIPILPMSSLTGENIAMTSSDNMGWFKGCDLISAAGHVQ